MTIGEAPVGTKIYLGSWKDTDFIWRKVSEDNDFLCEQGTGYRQFDNDEPANSNRNRRTGGNNFFPVSNIQQWLNSTETNWYHPLHEFDTGYVGYNDQGFLHDFNPEELDCLMDRTIKVAVPLGSRKEHGKVVEMACKVCLPSEMEVLGHCQEEANEVEGVHLPEIMNVINENFGRYITVMTRTAIENSCKVRAFYCGNPYVEKASNNIIPVPMIRLKGDIPLMEEYATSPIQHIKFRSNEHKDEEFFGLLTF